MTLGKNIDKQIVNRFERNRSTDKSFPIQDPSENNSMIFDLGHYPLLPWLNPIQENNPRDLELRKFDFFLPPRDRDDLFSVMCAECSS